jgi:hypothetical protein
MRRKRKNPEFNDYLIPDVAYVLDFHKSQELHPGA